jgi:hypothetical protein
LGKSATPTAVITALARFQPGADPAAEAFGRGGTDSREQQSTKIEVKACFVPWDSSTCRG